MNQVFVRKRTSSATVKLTFFGCIFFFSLALYIIFTSPTLPFIDGVNLVFHEAGHVFFMLFGDTLHFLGGSFLEIAIPTLIVLYFYFQKRFLEASVISVWFSTAIVSVAQYIADAPQQRLRLIGGEHDWAHLLGKFNLLSHASSLSFTVSIIGILFVVFFGGMSIIKLWQAYFRKTEHYEL